MTAPLLVGIGISTSAAPDSDPLADALAAERLGYDFVSASDHPAGNHPSFETATLLTWIAARTSRIGVATRVLGVPFRRPAMVAKAAESLQRLSGGRLILGLGGGYSDDEIAALGGAAPSPREKVDGLADAIQILHGVWRDTPFTYEGATHQVRGLAIEPKPIAPIPIWLGTYGPRALAVTGRLADGWIPSLGFAPPARVPELLDRIRTASAAAGRPAGAVRAIYNVPVQVDANVRPGADLVAGSAADVLDQLRALLDLGFTGLNIVPTSPADVVAVAEEVLEPLRAGP